MLEKLKKVWKTIEKKRYFDTYTIFDNARIRDKDAARYAAEHLHWWDRFDIRKVAEAVLYSQDILAGYAKPEDLGFDSNKHWKF